MAFNFNWSPLIADTDRAREMLTAALNKSPKPPIIVDDIIVTELNLGSTPPVLEILEIGDLAEDRFRGIFKMTYSGDAFLTLKTKVQANPLNTYLSTKPSFASPQPLAAASSLTIPLQITLSDIRLSGFVILVFSRQKGITIVFRNDPLESLKVSSTFDSIPFIRDYLQKEIERQLRGLFMEDLPAILHRMSLRLCSTDYQELVDEINTEQTDEVAPIDPLASPAHDPVDAFGNPIDERDLAFSMNDPSEVHASFSSKNMLRLAALNESQRTLSLFTPSLGDTVYRAWAGAAERGEHSGLNTPLTLSSLSRVNSFTNVHAVRSSASSVSDGSDSGTSSRPSLHTYGSSFHGLGAGRSRSTHRKRNKRVINLRGDRNGSDTASVSTETSTPPPTIAISDTCSVILEEKAEELATPPRSPQRPVRFREQPQRPKLEPIAVAQSSEEVSRASSSLSEQPEFTTSLPQRPRLDRGHGDILPPSSRAATVSPPLMNPYTSLHHPAPSTSSTSSALPLLRSYSLDKLAFHNPHVSSPLASSTSPPPSQIYSHPLNPSSPTSFDGFSMGSSGGILEQAWMLKMAREIARRVEEEQQKAVSKAAEANRPHNSANSSKSAGFWERSEELDDAPPAYAA
jgi:mitochondrial distribution and morphology protein 34